MESLYRLLSAPPPLPLLPPSQTLKSTPKSHIFLTNYIPTTSFNSPQLQTKTLTLNHQPNSTPSKTNPPFPYNFHEQLSFLISHKLFSIPNFSFLFLGSSLPLSCFASEITPALATEQASSKINLEYILVSIDNFFNRYPFFVYTVGFIWFIAIPLTEEYLQKYKFISAINAFKKLRDDPNSQLLDIRESKSLAVLGSPNLKILNKSTLQVEFRQGEEDSFVKMVLENFGDPSNTIVCVIDNFDGNSIKVAELLVKNGFKEAYAIRGGIMGEKGWQEIQESLLPLSVRVYPKKRAKVSKQVDTNGGIQRQDINMNDEYSSSNTSSIAKKSSKEVQKGDFSSISPTIRSNGDARPLSPYPNYPDYKPPSSPTPSKP